MDCTKIIAEKSAMLEKTADKIWNCAETAFTEYDSVKALIDALAAEGFEIKEKEAGIDTAFSARFGSGKPVIGILGEFDALSGLSQKPGINTKDPITPGGNGHGCGHHLLGAAGIGAATAIKEYLTKSGKSGTIIYYGCPGEEGGSGKAFMARDGVFDGLDAAITWHPADVNAVSAGSTLANVQVSYKFKGIAAHAAAVPHLGRSALDAVELMNVGVNFLREHVIPEARMHYSITNPGGYSPNVVQAEAEVLYLLRAPKNSQVQDICKRVNKIAQGAAMMTETEVEIDFVKACSNIIPNNTLEKVLQHSLETVPLPEYSRQDFEFAAKMQDSFENSASTVEKIADKISDPRLKKKVLEYKGKPLLDMVMPYIPSEEASPGSSDVGDVSWVCPTAQINTVCYAANTPGHSWQLVAQGLADTAHKGMLYAARVMADTVIHLYENPEILRRAKKEFAARVGDGYKCPIPEGVKPRSIAPKK